MLAVALPVERRAHHHQRVAFVRELSFNHQRVVPTVLRQLLGLLAELLTSCVLVVPFTNTEHYSTSILVRVNLRYKLIRLR